MNRIPDGVSADGRRFAQMEMERGRPSGARGCENAQSKLLRFIRALNSCLEFVLKNQIPEPATDNTDNTDGMDVLVSVQ